jgi:hypothetical protein
MFVDRARCRGEHPIQDLPARRSGVRLRVSMQLPRHWKQQLQETTMLRILSFFAIALLGISAFAAFRLLEASLAADVYRERLAEMAADYETLRGRYNQAVRRTAVTELRVVDGKLTVVIRTADGELQALESPFDPSNEIYVDYVVMNGRLWIRRVFDAKPWPGEPVSAANTAAYPSNGRSRRFRSTTFCPCVAAD